MKTITRLSASMILVVCFASAGNRAAVCSTPIFKKAGVFPSGPNSTFVTVGDFNGDGKLDLAVASAGSSVASGQSPEGGGVSILLGNGDGSFKTAVSYPAGISPYSIAVGDFNGDGKLDLAVLSQSISILIGNGDGTFQDALPVLEDVGGTSLVVGDFDHDGKLDLAVTGVYNSIGDGGLAVLLGRGDGRFQPDVFYSTTGDYPELAIAGDFNGDNILDLAVASGLGTASGGRVSVLLGIGHGTFQEASSFSVSSAGIALGDFNRDGRPDLVAVGTTSQGGAQGVGNVTVLSGKGDGTFQTRVSYGVGQVPTSVAVGDLNGDGWLDLAVASSDGGIFMLLGNGDSTFRSVALDPGTGPPSNPPSIALGDFNGDGKLDLVVADNSSNVSVMLNSGASSSSPATFVLVGEFFLGNTSSSLVVGDFNDDGKPDLATADNYSDSQGLQHNSVSISLGNGDGTFQPAVNYSTGTGTPFLAAGDFNGDGKLDLAGISYGDYDASSQNYTGSIVVLLGKVGGAFQLPTNYPTELPESGRGLTVRDVNGDGKLDLVIDTRSTAGAFVLLGVGDGTFQTAVRNDSAAPASYGAVGDFNGDGVPDLAEYGPEGISVSLGKRDGTFMAARTYGTGGFLDANLEPIAMDLNGDGKLDLITAVTDGYSVIVGNGDGTFQEAAFYAAPGGKYVPTLAVAVADINGDGKPDIVTISENGEWDGATVWLNTSCLSSPDLAIARNQSVFTISWPFPSAGYVLESTTNLNSTNWNAISTMPVNNQGRLEIATPTTQSRVYFRLRKP
jgi:FG-GAP-like repeat